MRELFDKYDLLIEKLKGFLKSSCGILIELAMKEMF